MGRSYMIKKSIKKLLNDFIILMRTLNNFLYKLFFTRDDDLDMLQVLFAMIICVTLFVTWNVMVQPNDFTSEAVKIEALVTLRWLAGLLVITAVPKWLVPSIQEIVTKKLQINKPKEEVPFDETTPC
jgi:hypothetical protein